MTTKEAKLAQCESLIQYQFKNKALGIGAIEIYQAESSSASVPEFVQRQMEVLAILGQSVLTCRVSRNWLSDSTATWSSASNPALNDYLMNKATEMGLQDCLIVPSDLKIDQRMAGIAVRAIMGAVHLDGGDEALDKVLTALQIDHKFLYSELDAGYLHLEEEEASVSTKTIGKRT